MPANFISQKIIEDKIFLIRGHKVMVDRDLAELYGVDTKVLNQAVKRNIKRFPSDFMFRLTEKEFSALRSHFVTSKRGGQRYLPYAFTEQGVAMLSSVLHSEQAIQVNIAIMRVFVKLKEMLSAHKELIFKLRELEQKVEGHDKAIHAIFEAIRKLMAEEQKPKKIIGFHPNKEARKEEEQDVYIVKERLNRPEIVGERAAEAYFVKRLKNKNNA